MSRSIRLSKEHGLNPTMPVCFVCGEPTGEIALLGAAYHGEAPMHMVLDKRPCGKCRSIMEKAVILISVRDGSDHENPYRTGGWVAIKPEAAEKIFGAESTVLKTRCAFLEDKAWDKIGLPRNVEINNMETETKKEGASNEG